MPMLPCNQIAVESVPIQALDPTLTAQLAEHYGLYTVGEVRDPGTFGEFRKAKRTEEQLGRLATNVCVSLAEVPGYQDTAQEDIGPKLANAFNTITAIHADGVHKIDTIDGKTRIGARLMSFTVPTKEDAQRLHDPLQILLTTHALNRNHLVNMFAGDGRYTVTVTNMNEHIARVLDIATGELMAQSDYAKYSGAILPPDNRALEFWERRGETMPRSLRTRLLQVDAAYQKLALSLTASYDGFPNMRPDKDPNILAGDAAPALQGMRNIFNSLIKEIRGSSIYNEEQDPDKTARLRIEDGIDLRRAKATLDDVKDGPGRSHAATLTERSIDTGREVYANAQKHPVLTAVKIGSKILGASVEGLLELGIVLAPPITKGAKRFRNDRKDWILRKQAAQNSARHIGSLLPQLG